MLNEQQDVKMISIMSVTVQFGLYIGEVTLNRISLSSSVIH